MACTFRSSQLAASSQQAMDHLVNSADKLHYMSRGNISVLIVFRGLNGTALGVGTQHSEYSNLHNVPVYNQYRSSTATTSSIVIGGGSEGGRMVGIAVVAATIAAATIASSGGGKDKQMAKIGMAMVMLHYL
ncbi:Pyruvate dehydrogenase E1 component subunit beta-2, mitochondrial [Capsicum chinense]|nr:Pyruvate dehydrogenase E1 component subunit beta-2, mitochondrial [Capsicum chinense]